MTLFGWTDADPVQVTDPDNYEMGTEFVSNVDLTLTHVRIFSGAGPIDQSGRLGRIWTTGGLQLGQATMPTTLTPGWTLHALDTPVPCPSGTRFIVSGGIGGNYAAITNAFQLAAHVSSNGALTSRKASDAVNGNGIFNTTVGNFPASNFNSTFYGVDVGYDLGIGGNTAPTITALSLTTPGDGVTVNAAISATDAETLVGATYFIDWGDGSTTSAASGQHTYASSGLKAVLGSVTDAGGLSDYAAAAIQLTEPGTVGLDVVEIQGALISHALTLGLFASVNGFEPKAAPMDGLHGALWLASIEPARGRSGLNTTTVRLVFNFRVGINMLAEPQDDIDLRVLVATAALMRQYSGDFELGGAIKNVDLLGETGPPLAAQAGYLNQDSKLFRVMVITIPLIINDVFDQSP
jgi:hypothetical protein